MGGHIGAARHDTEVHGSGVQPDRVSLSDDYFLAVDIIAIVKALRIMAYAGATAASAHVTGREAALSTGTDVVSSTAATAAATNTRKSAVGKSASWIGSCVLVFGVMLISMVC
jgi:hypothetical protein